MPDEANVSFFSVRNTANIICVNFEVWTKEALRQL